MAVTFCFVSKLYFYQPRIHPFDDGNGRGARILMNLILIKKGYPPAIIKNEQRRKYLTTLNQADSGELEPFLLFIAQSLINTQLSILEDMGSAESKL
ncbi:Fic family protein [Candidatus Parabeggiatoa sp. HSG14]|uniref:Fic family protein n=1 Tax=Candidatus Parabeggiatoa sp. HSG14 TaxID=3055593 RepID=UPI0025A839D9|nr:Fic family protein [Thiotrichales bacterium HSG14]